MHSSKSLVKWEKDTILWYIPLITYLQGGFQTTHQHDLVMIHANTNPLIDSFAVRISPTHL